MFRRTLENGEQLVVAERLLDVVEGAFVHRLHRRLERSLGGHENDRHLWIALPHMAQHLHPGHIRHAHIGQHDVGLEFVEPFDALSPTMGGDGGEPLGLEQNAE
jgi:hypothetical protein